METFGYQIKISSRARHLRLQISRDLKVQVVLPLGVPVDLAKNFVLKKTPWITKTLNYLKKIPPPSFIKGGRRDYLKQKHFAHAIARAKVNELNQYYNFPVNRICIRNQSTRWGSCSRKGNLNFNYKIVYLPAILLNYLVVHELCHLKEMNHSKAFWNLVGQTVPNFRELRKQLQKFQ